MSQKTFNLVSTITTSIAAIAIGIVTYIKPQYATAINDSIVIAEGAVIAICGNFVDKTK